MLGTRPRGSAVAMAPKPVADAVPRHERRSIRAPDPAVILLLVLAFGLRVWELGVKSLWLDEGISYAFALDAPPKLFQTLIERDLHPPLYYLVLHYWMVVAGTSETALRFPSVLIGTIFVALLYRFARQLYAGSTGRAIALLASALGATSPFLVYYAQEARMYGALATAGLAATIALWAALARSANHRPRWAIGRWAIYALLLTVLPYIHHFGWMVVGVHGVYVLLLARRSVRILPPFLGAVAVAVLLYLPWLPAAIAQIQRLRQTPDFWEGALSFWFVARSAFASFALGFGGAVEQYPTLLVVFLVVFGLGAAALLLRAVVTGREADLLLIVYFLVPLVVLYALVAQNPKFADRYLIVILPPFLILLARGVVSIAEAGALLERRIQHSVWLGRALSATLAFVVVSLSLREATNVYSHEAYRKDDFRSTVDYLIRNWHEDDAVLLMMDTYPVFDYYSHGWLKRFGLNPNDDLGWSARELNGIVSQGYDRLWVVIWNADWADPSGGTRELLDLSAERVPLSVSGFHGTALRLYRTSDRPYFDPNPTPDRAFDARFGDEIQLRGVDLTTSIVTPGSSANVGLYWQAIRETDRNLAVSLRLRRGGFEWSRRDGRPAAYTYPTSAWRLGVPVRGNLALDIPNGTPPGEYSVDLIVYDPETRRELPLQQPNTPEEATSLTLGTIQIGQSDELDVAPPEGLTPMSGQFAGSRLEAASISRTSALPGSTLEVALAMRLTSPPSSRVVTIALEESTGRRWQLAQNEPLVGAYPVSRWRTGELIVDRARVTLPAGIAAGPAMLLVGIAEPGADVELLPIGQVEIEGRAVNLVPTSPTADLDARFGDFAKLLSVELPAEVRRGESLPLTFHWHALQTTDRSYSLFVHLIGSDERPLAQRDILPQDGRAPTSGWIAGEFLRDEVRLDVPTSVPPGDYRIVVGLYDKTTGQRLPAFDDDQRQSNDRVVVGTVRVN